MKNQELINYLETSLGRKLSKDEMNQASFDDMRVSQAKTQLQHHQALRIKRKKERNMLFFKQVCTALMTAVICLVIILPITLGVGGINNGGIYDPPINREMFRESRNEMIFEQHLRQINNILLFEEMFWIHSRMELALREPLILGYLVNGAVFDESELTFMDKRIRINRYFAFAGYFEAIYATLEESHRILGSSVRNPENIYTFNVERVWCPTIENPEYERLNINAFRMNGVTVFAFVSENSAGTFAQIYFEFAGFEYFIELREAETEITIEFIKNVFMQRLLENAKTTTIEGETNE